jgi:hypothetical protein
MATPQENLARFQEISNRGLQDQLPADKRARFDEAVSRGLVQSKEAGFPGAGIIEPALAVATAIPASIASGVTGLVSGAVGGSDAAASVQKDVQEDLTFKPRTEAGKEGLQTLGDIVKFGGDVLNVPLSGLTGLVELVSSGFDFDKAAETVRSTQKQGIKKELGGQAFEATGSPLAATLAELIPDIAMTAAGFKSAPKLAQATKQAGQEFGPIIEAGGQLAKDIKRFKTPKTREIARQLNAGVIDRDLANFKLSDMGIENPTIRQQLLGADLPKVTRNTTLMDASKQGFDDGFLNSTSKLTTNTDKKLMLKMTDIGEKGRKNPFFGDEFRPADVAGEVYLNKINDVKAINRAAGKEIGQAAKKLKGKEFPVADIGDNFLEALDGLKVKVIDGKLNFDDALVSGAGRKKAIQDVFGRMVRNKNPDALDLHELKQFIDETVSYGKSIRGLSGKAERTLKDLRLSIKNRLEENFPEYATANKAYSDSIGALDEVQRLAGKNTDLTSNSASGTLASLARRLTSEAQSRGQVAESLKQLDEVLKEHAGRGVKLLEGKGDGAANLRVLMKYANELDRVTGSAANTSFTGASENAIKAAVGPKQFIADKAVEAAKGLAGVSQENAYKAMREFLKSELKIPQK